MTTAVSDSGSSPYQAPTTAHIGVLVTDRSL
jgi:hypothetical protein